MIIINKSGASKYSTVAHRSLAPGQKSADLDMGGFRKSLSEVLKSCGSACCVRLNDEERRLVSRLLALDDQGRGFHCHVTKAAPMSLLSIREEHEKQEKMARIRDEQAREEAIRAETTYASRKDIDQAKAKSGLLKGEIKAKKLESKDVTGTVSLNDLMGDNKFIEESMKHSNIPSAVASEEGWDMDKMTATDSKESKATFQEISAKPVNPVKLEKASRPATAGTAEAPSTSKVRKGIRK